jgi:hypothetical protein
MGSQRFKLRTSEFSESMFAFFVGFCSFFLVVARCEQVTEETAGCEEDDPGCSA